MRKTMEAVLVFGLIWIGYIAWPLYDLLVLLHAIETRDVDTVTRHVYLGSVRISLTNQIVAAYVRRTGIQIGLLRRNIAAAAIADPVVKRLVSPEALTELLAVGWPITVLPDPPPGTIGTTRSPIGTIWQIFGSSEYGLGRYEVAEPSALPPQQRFLLTFRLLQWRGNWSASSYRRIFRTCSRMSSSRRRCEHQRKSRDAKELNVRPCARAFTFVSLVTNR
jgi:hypothetical protein